MLVFISFVRLWPYSPGAAVELAASRKCEKYAHMPNSYIFQPIAFKNVGTLNSSAVALISSLGHKISTKSNDLRESTFLFSAPCYHSATF